MRSGATVLLGVSGGIAAYKSCGLVRALTRGGADVHAVMTESATHLVGPVTFYTLTGNPVLRDLWSLEGTTVPHISLVDRGDVLVVAPATANIIGKAAHGIADDALSTILLAFDGPKIMAPAMNWRMWSNPVLQENLARLRRVGYRIVPPVEGPLACGEDGAGRMAELAHIVSAVKDAVEESDGADESTAGYSGLRVLITAGATREHLDPVRYLSNRASGELGHLIAAAFSSGGAQVTLVTAAGRHLPVATDVQCFRVTSAAEMYDEVMAHFETADVVIASAGVCDWRPEHRSTEKVKKSAAGSPVVTLVPNVDILEELGRRRNKQVLVGFAAESERITAAARDKLRRKNLDLIIANDVRAADTGPGKALLKPVLVFRDGRQEAGAALSKQEWAGKLTAIAAQLAGQRS